MNESIEWTVSAEELRAAVAAERARVVGILTRIEQELYYDSAALKLTASLRSHFAGDRPEKERAAETTCQQCGRENAVWFAPSDLWNLAAPDGGVLCPVCFMQAAERAGVQTTAWLITTEERAGDRATTGAPTPDLEWCITTLRSALENWGRHHPWCDVLAHSSSWRCNCGLAEVIAGPQSFMTREWCFAMAEREGEQEIGAGDLVAPSVAPDEVCANCGQERWEHDNPMVPFPPDCKAFVRVVPPTAGEVTP